MACAIQNLFRNLAGDQFDRAAAIQRINAMSNVQLLQALLESCE